VETRIDVDLALGRHDDVVPELQALVAEHRLRERFRGQLILALYRSGRKADALHVYEDARLALAEELASSRAKACSSSTRRSSRTTRPCLRPLS